MTDQTARCIVERDPKLIVAWLETLPGSRREAAVVRVREGGFSLCFHSSWLMSSWQPVYEYPAMRVLIVRTLIKNEIVSVPKSPPAALDQPKWYFADPQAGRDETVAMVANNLGYCLAKSDWDSTRTIVLAPPESPDRGAAIRRLVPLIDGCVPSGSRITLDVARIVSVLEETAYHVSGGATVAMLRVPGIADRKAD